LKTTNDGCWISSCGKEFHSWLEKKLLHEHNSTQMVYSGRVGGAEHKDGGASSPKYLPLDPNFLQIDVMESLIVASGR